MSAETPNEAPRRLLEDAGLDADLRAHLDAGMGQDPLSYDVDAGWARHEARIGADAAAAAGTASSGLGPLTKLALILVGSGGILALAKGLDSRSEPTGTPRSEALAQANTDDQKPPAAPEAAPEEPAEAPVPVPVPVPVPGSEDKASKSKPTPSAVPNQPPPPADDDAVLREMKQVAEAKKSLAGDPAHTLALVKAGDTEFPKGHLVAERRGLEVLALHALGRQSAAETKKTAYLKRFPKGPHADKIRALFDDEKNEKD